MCSTYLGPWHPLFQHHLTYLCMTSSPRQTTWSSAVKGKLVTLLLSVTVKRTRTYPWVCELELGSTLASLTVCSLHVQDDEKVLTLRPRHRACEAVPSSYQMEGRREAESTCKRYKGMQYSYNKEAVSKLFCITVGVRNLKNMKRNKKQSWKMSTSCYYLPFSRS